MRQAREAGAVDCIAKPRLSDIEGCREVREAICNTIYAASRVPVASFAAHPVVPKLSADVVLRKVQRSPPPAATPPVLVIGASTGGTEALSFLLRQLPASMPGIVIVQHMPEFFTASFADRLNRLSALSVKEAAPGDEVGAGQVILARGNRHVILRRRHHRYSVELLDGPPVSRHRPSVDVLFRSAAQQAGAHAIGVLLTGMGDDGAAGMLELKQSGAITIAQDRESSTVFGMPNEAIKQGGVDRILPLDQIASALIQLIKEQRTRFPATDDIPAKDNRS
jgi:two-component system chemotaxis response regulator CheB